MGNVGIARAFAPASVGNVGVGFDILGHALVAVGDTVEAARTRRETVTLSGITGIVASLPDAAEQNTAGRAVQAMWETLRPGFGVTLAIEKGIPLGSGMGGSAASAVAAVVAANALLEEPLGLRELLPFAIAGEAVASGSVHVDNVAASLLGGLVFAFAGESRQMRVRKIEVPAALRCVLVHPACEVRTRDARQALDASVPLATVTEHCANLAGVLLAVQNGDLGLLRESLEDVLIEPQRAHLVPGFAAVKQAALDSGALGCSLSGSGPSLFAWVEAERAQSVADAMCAAFENCGMGCDYWISPIDAPGARVTEAGK